MEKSESLFGGRELASGYALARPAVHPKIIALALRRLGGSRFRRVLDIGCGGGASTHALAPVAEACFGLEPAASMLVHARRDSRIRYVAGRAEGMPFPDESMDFMTAAGSLNYVGDLRAAFREARRVLRPGSGAGLLVYDFSPGRNSALEGWFQEFMGRFPRPQDGARRLNPEVLAGEADGVLRLGWGQEFSIPLMIGHEAYVDYMMTETNVADAVRRGVASAAEIRDWCFADTAGCFAGVPQHVEFRGYAAFLQ